MKAIPVIFILLLAQFDTQAQHAGNNKVYVEFLGTGGRNSINYERAVWQKKKLAAAIRAGVGSYRLRDFELKFNPDITVPVGVNVFYGHKHKALLGVGETFSSTVLYDAGKRKKIRDGETSTTFCVGYAYEHKSGLLFRIAYTPVLQSQKTLIQWGGVSVGYSF
jgi:hypothetical protein